MHIRTLLLTFCFGWIFILNNPTLALGQTKVWSLQACVNQAVEKNIQILQTGLNNETNKINFQQQYYNRLPSLSARATQGVNFGRSIDPFTNQFIQQTIYNNNFSLNANMVLFNGFQNNNLIKQNELWYEAGKLDVEKAKNDISLSVVNAYLQIILGQEQLKAAKIQAENTKAQLERAEKLVANGGASEIITLQLRSQSQTDVVTQTNIKNTIALAKMNLQQLMLEEVKDTFEVENITIPDNIPPFVGNSKEVYQSALQNQPQIMAQKYRVLGAMKSVEVAKGTMYPQLLLTGAIGTLYSSSAKTFLGQTQTGRTDTLAFVNGFAVTRPNTVSVTEPTPFGRQLENNMFQNVNLVLNVPIFNNFQSKASIQRAKVNLKLAELNAENVKLQLRRDIEQAQVNFSNAWTRWEAVKNQVRTLELSYQLAEKRFNAGASNVTEYILEKNNYNRALFDLSQAKYEMVFRKKILDFYMGNPLF